jgi:hypothetical protein
MKLITVHPDLLAALATEAPKPAESDDGNGQHGGNGKYNGKAFDLARWIRNQNLNVKEPEPWRGGTRWVFPVCPFNSDHANGSAAIVQRSGGQIGFKCHHNSCTGNDWHKLRERFEPDAYRHNSNSQTADLAEFGIEQDAEALWNAAPLNGDGERCALPAETLAETGLVLTTMNTVERQPVAWLWFGRLVMGAINLFFGDPDAGKSTTAIYVIAQVSTGGEWPDGSGPAPQGTSFVLTLEDGIATTLGPRLDAAGADSSKVIALSMLRFLDEQGKISERAFTLDMVAHVRDALAKHPDTKLIVIDPPSSCLPEYVNENSNAGVRSILAPWAKLAEEKNVAVLFITHRPKGGTAKAVHGALGSLAWLAAARAAWMFAKDKDDPLRKLFLRAKCNLAPPVPNLAYRIVGPVAHTEWDGQVETTADDVTRADADPGRPGPDPKKLEAATEWLAAELADLGEHKVADLKAAAKDAGLVWRTLQRASAKLGVKVQRGTYGGGYVWRLPKP